MSISDAGYFLSHSADGLSVDAWTRWALPFRDRCTPAHVEYRRALSKSLMLLEDRDLLHATHTSQANPKGTDLENLLFYNVGASAFRRLAKNAVQFERKEAPLPPSPIPLEFEPKHHVRYSVRSAAHSNFHHTAASPPVATSRAICPAAKQMKDLPGLWRSFKEAMVIAVPSIDLNGQPFSIQITVSGSARHNFNLTTIVKPITDAFISALHSYEGKQLEEIAKRISLYLSCPVEYVRQLLADRHSALLGPKAVPHLRGNGLQWSPADDRMMACEIMRRISPAEGAIEIGGSLFREAAPLV